MNHKLYSIYKALSVKYNIPIDEIERICRYQFKNVVAEIKSGQLKTIQLPYFGKFAVKPKRKEYINGKIEQARASKGVSVY